MLLSAMLAGFLTGVHKSEECFITTGYRNWKHATGKSGRLEKHTVSQRQNMPWLHGLTLSIVRSLTPDLVSNHDSVMKTKLHNGPKNAVYTSHGIQDELLHILAKSVRHIIYQRVKEAGFYGIIVDESRDSSKQEQMSFAVHYMDEADGVFMSIF